LTGYGRLVGMTAAEETTLKEVGEMLTHVVAHMATKDDIASLDTRLDKLDVKIDNVESSLVSKIDRMGTKLTKFEENQIDKRLQLEVRRGDREASRDRQEDCGVKISRAVVVW
jgi:hypothetical protein